MPKSDSTHCCGSYGLDAAVTLKLTIHVSVLLDVTVTMLVYVPTARPVGFTEIVRMAGSVLLLKEADSHFAPSVRRVKATGSVP